MPVRDGLAVARLVYDAPHPLSSPPCATEGMSGGGCSWRSALDGRPGVAPTSSLRRDSESCGSAAGELLGDSAVRVAAAGSIGASSPSSSSSSSSSLPAHSSSSQLAHSLSSTGGSWGASSWLQAEELVL